MCVVWVRMGCACVCIYIPEVFIGGKGLGRWYEEGQDYNDNSVWRRDDSHWCCLLYIINNTTRIYTRISSDNLSRRFLPLPLSL